MSTTPAERQASLKARRKAAGLVQVKVWVHPDWRECIKLEAKYREQPICEPGRSYFAALTGHWSRKEPDIDSHK